ncbi:MAG TPA: FHA domain-containing protein [Vicinamibacterales bacterium]
MRVIFEGCVFDAERRQLTRGGSVVRTGPKLLSLLELLLESRPRALTKREIHEKLWPGTFVTDATLTSLVAELRGAIGDDARTPRLVRTIHGYGYAFAGEAAPETEPPPTRHADLGRSYRVIFGDREVALSSGEHILGRSNEVAIFVDSVGVSRQHARITITPDGARVEDLGSKNGTRVNGRLVDAPMDLFDGAVIVLGTTALKFRIFETAKSTETVST